MESDQEYHSRLGKEFDTLIKNHEHPDQLSIVDWSLGNLKEYTCNPAKRFELQSNFTTPLLKIQDLPM